MLGFYAHCLTACSRQFGVMNIVNWHVLQSNQINFYIFYLLNTKSYFCQSWHYLVRKKTNAIQVVILLCMDA